MPGDVGRTSPVQGWLGYGWLIAFWGVMLLFFQTVVVLGMHVPYVFIYSDACILTVLFVISLRSSCCFTYLPCHIACCISSPISCH